MNTTHAEKQYKELQNQVAAEQTKYQGQLEEMRKLKLMEAELKGLHGIKDSNRMLREETKSLNDELRSVNSQLSSLQNQISPLQTRIRGFSAHHAAAEAGKKLASEEAQRWKERVDQMTSSSRWIDPEEYRRLLSENRPSR